MIKVKMPYEWVCGSINNAYWEVKMDEKDYKRFDELYYKQKENTLTFEEEKEFEELDDAISDMGHWIISDFDIKDYSPVIWDSHEIIN